MRYLRLFFKLCAFLIALCVILLIANFIAFKLWIQGGQFVTEPIGNVLPTAEYLYVNPLPTPYQIERIKVHQEEVSVCIRTHERIIGGDILFTRWFLNGERVPYERYLFFRYWVPDYCVGLYGVLPGIHLLEIDINASPFYTAMSYQWAIKIEPTPTPSPTPSSP